VAILRDLKPGRDPNPQPGPPSRSASEDGDTIDTGRRDGAMTEGLAPPGGIPSCHGPDTGFGYYAPAFGIVNVVL